MNAVVDQNCQNSCQCFVDSFATGNQIQGNFIDEMAHYIFPAFQPKIPLFMYFNFSSMFMYFRAQNLWAVLDNLYEISFPLNKEGPDA